MKKHLPLLSLFFLSPSSPLKSVLEETHLGSISLEETHLGSISSVVNYFQRTIQAEIKTFISLINTSKCLYLHYNNGAFSSSQEPFPSLSKVKRGILEKIPQISL